MFMPYAEVHKNRRLDFANPTVPYPQIWTYCAKLHQDSNATEPAPSWPEGGLCSSQSLGGLAQKLCELTGGEDIRLVSGVDHHNMIVLSDDKSVFGPIQYASVNDDELLSLASFYMLAKKEASEKKKLVRT